MSTNFHFTSDIPADSTIAVGDVHGQIELLERFLAWVKDSGARVILLGDLIDRAKNPGDDLKVLERVQELIQDPESWGLASFTSLRGNHETMFIDAAEGYGLRDWRSNGGDWDNLDAMAPHAVWLRELPYYVTVGDTLFSHAGVFPGESPKDSMYFPMSREKFVWNRGSFLTVGPQFEKWSKTLKKVVFGHTPQSALPYQVPNGICIDTAAYHTGTLTAYNSTYNTFMSFDAE